MSKWHCCRTVIRARRAWPRCALAHRAGQRALPAFRIRAAPSDGEAGILNFSQSSYTTLAKAHLRRRPGRRGRVRAGSAHQREEGQWRRGPGHEARSLSRGSLPRAPCSDSRSSQPFVNHNGVASGWMGGSRPGSFHPIHHLSRREPLSQFPNFSRRLFSLKASVLT
jgi:hypothetical protein